MSTRPGRRSSTEACAERELGSASLRCHCEARRLPHDGRDTGERYRHHTSTVINQTGTGDNVLVFPHTQRQQVRLSYGRQCDRLDSSTLYEWQTRAVRVQARLASPPWM